jgi:hypothetical protein
MPECSTYTFAATEFHRFCVCVAWLQIHVSVFVPLVYGVRDAATVERAHRGEIRDAERAELRRQFEASDCARTTELTLISNAKDAARRRHERGDDAEVCCRWGPGSATRKKLGQRSFRRCRSGDPAPRACSKARCYCWLALPQAKIFETSRVRICWIDNL